MPQKLEQLTIDEVSLVDAPANSQTVDGKRVARARVALYKRDTDVDKAASGVKLVLGFPKDGGGSQVQSVIFDKKKWDLERAKAWLKSHDFGGTTADETGESLRFRQKDPGGFSHFRTIAPGSQETKKLRDAVVKAFYPPLGATDVAPKARTFEEVYSGLEQMEEFKEMGDEFQEKVNALCQSVWTILSDESVTDKQGTINLQVDQFVASVKEGLSEEDEEYHKAIDGGGYVVSKDGKTQAGRTFPKGDFAYTPDDVPSHWKLRLTATPGGAPDAKIVGAAVAALGKGFRGKKVQIPAESLPGVKAKVRAAWKKANPDKGDEELPDILKRGDPTMTIEAIEKRITEQDDVIKAQKAELAVLKTENELVMKMSKKERKAFSAMSDDEKKNYLAGDEEKRKAMMEKTMAKLKEKALCDTMDEATKKRFEKAGPNERAEMLEKARKAKKAKPAPPDSEDDDTVDDEEDYDKARKALVTKLDEHVALVERITKMEQEVAKTERQQRILKYAKVAETDLSHTPGSPEEKGKIIMKLADSLGEGTEEFTKVLQSMKDADRNLAVHFREVGKAGGPIPAGAAFDAKVAEIRKRDNCDEPHAIDKLLKEAPELYVEYDEQKRRMIANR